jgi:hypothetical protein
MPDFGALSSILQRTPPPAPPAIQFHYYRPTVPAPSPPPQSQQTHPSLRPRLLSFCPTWTETASISSAPLRNWPNLTSLSFCCSAALCCFSAAELDRNRTVEESRDWSPSSSGYFHGSNH